MDENFVALLIAKHKADKEKKQKDNVMGINNKALNKTITKTILDHTQDESQDNQQIEAVDHSQHTADEPQ